MSFDWLSEILMSMRDMMNEKNWQIQRTCFALHDVNMSKVKTGDNIYFLIWRIWTN